jgi:uncharacterized membrane protein YqgA involved in biofilm formation
VIGIGTIVNVIAIIVGSLVGLFFARFFTERVRMVIMQGLALSILLIGFSMALKTTNILIVIGSMVLGGATGELLRIEERLDSLGERLKKRFRSGSATFVTGFVTASLVYCVGAMAVVGSLDEGIRHDPHILFAKSLLDGVASIAFASTLGVGVVFSAISVFIYQGALTLLGMFFGTLLSPTMVSELTAAGGLLILGIGLNILFAHGSDISSEDPIPESPESRRNGARMLGIGRRPAVSIKIGNLLPALFWAVLIAWVVEKIGG